MNPNDVYQQTFAGTNSEAVKTDTQGASSPRGDTQSHKSTSSSSESRDSDNTSDAQGSQDEDDCKLPAKDSSDTSQEKQVIPNVKAIQC